MFGTIVGVEASGGIITLTLKNKDGSKTTVHADNGPLVRALNEAFPGFIVPGHRFDSERVVGEQIEYEVDDLGMMAGFQPA